MYAKPRSTMWETWAEVDVAVWPRLEIQDVINPKAK
jgi:hypothetical protein